MSTGGTRTKGEALVVREATARGWERLGRSGTNHIKLRWPSTGRIYRIPSKMDDRLAQIVILKLAKLESTHA